jgi:hypothetical protein
VIKKVGLEPVAQTPARRTGTGGLY